jgi:hypothetical protein
MGLNAAWLTDIHLEFASEARISRLSKEIISRVLTGGTEYGEPVTQKVLTIR